MDGTQTVAVVGGCLGTTGEGRLCDTSGDRVHHSAHLLVTGEHGNGTIGVCRGGKQEEGRGPGESASGSETAHPLERTHAWCVLQRNAPPPPPPPHSPLMALTDIHDDDVSLLDLPGQDALREAVLNQAHDGAAQRAGSVRRVESVVYQPVLELLSLHEGRGARGSQWGVSPAATQVAQHSTPSPHINPSSLVPATAVWS